ncbi:MAG: hypothetical protein WBA46_02335 [Thermomicrobiales bacterium]
MASSLTQVGSAPTPKPRPPRIPRSLPETSFDDIVAAVAARGRRIGERTARQWREDPALAAWQYATAPLWLGSGVPRPARPVLARHSHADEMAPSTTTQGLWLTDQVHALTRRFWLAWIASSTLRGVALGAIACTIWTLGAIQGALPQPRLIPYIAVVIVGAVLGLAFGLVNRPSVTRVAMMLDRTFDLHERMITAFTAPPAELSPRIRSIQLADAANAFEEIRTDVRGAAVLPMREMVIAALAGIALITALLFNIASTGIPATDPAQLPAFVPSSERFAREAQEQKAQQLADAAKQPAAAAPVSTPGSGETPGELTSLRAVGNALGTNKVTAPSASSIAQGDFPGAKGQLKDNAQAAANLPQKERDALAGELDHAASGMPDGKLKDATQKAADGLREGGDAAVSGLNDLADQIGASGEQATSQGQAPANNDQSSSSSSRSQSNGQSSSQGSQSGSSQQAQSGTSSSDQSGSSAANNAPQGNPGSGVAAAPGIGSDPAAGDKQGQPGNTDGGSTSAQGGGGQAGQAGQAGQSGQSASSSSSSGSGGQPGGAPSGQPGSSGQGAEKSSQASASDSSGSQGGGASGSTSPTGSSDPKAGGGGNGTEQKPADTAQNGKASSNPPPGNGQQGNGSSNGQQPTAGNETLVLQGTSDNGGVATGNDSVASSSGSGSGAGAASGGAKQGAVGPAGPDSNRVPDRYRDLVKAYFDGDGLPPDEEQP